MLDRSAAPKAASIDNFDFEKAQTIFLNNNVPVHYVRAGTQEVIKVELIVNSGSNYEAKPQAAFFTFHMLAEGTRTKSANDISNLIDFYGAQVDVSVGGEYSSVSLYCLTKQLPVLAPLLRELVQEASFPDEELEILKAQALQSLIINQERPAYMASSMFKNILFPGEPYGRIEKPEHIEEICREDCIAYHDEQLKDNYQLLVSGNFSESDLRVIGDVFEKNKSFQIRSFRELNLSGDIEPKSYYAEKDGAMQSAVRLGKKMFTKDHPDFFGFSILSGLLGGFFGSRLMKRIREEKGLTYGIHAALVPMIQQGYWMVAAEVKSENTKEALEAIREEIECLRSVEVPAEELERARRYILGQFLSSISNPFALAEKFKSVYLYGLGYEYFDKYIDKIQHITPKELRDLALKYLDPSSMVEVVAGPPVTEEMQ
ncbi:MAG: insulinase family protein [Cytophagales bacterium]|nr:insulinase family protein [Cytophagales bacterium]